MKNSGKWYLQRWVWIIGGFLLLSIPIIISECYIFGTKDTIIYTAFSAEDVLGFYGTMLSFLGMIALSILALWQNNRLNEINVRMQATQLRDRLGILLPSKKLIENGEFAKLNPLLPVRCGGLIRGSELYDDNENTLHISLQNRGNDAIFNCYRLKTYIDNIATPNKNQKMGLLIEVGEAIKFDYNVRCQNENQKNTFSIITTVSMQNSFGLEYYQLVLVTLSRSPAHFDEFTISAYNSTISSKIEEIEAAVSALLSF